MISNPNRIRTIFGIQHGHAEHDGRIIRKWWNKPKNSKRKGHKPIRFRVEYEEN